MNTSGSASRKNLGAARKNSGCMPLSVAIVCLMPFGFWALLTVHVCDKIEPLAQLRLTVVLHDVLAQGDKEHSGGRY